MEQIRELLIEFGESYYRNKDAGTSVQESIVKSYIGLFRLRDITLIETAKKEVAKQILDEFGIHFNSIGDMDVDEFHDYFIRVKKKLRLKYLGEKE